MLGDRKNTTLNIDRYFFWVYGCFILVSWSIYFLRGYYTRELCIETTLCTLLAVSVELMRCLVLRSKERRLHEQKNNFLTF